MQTTKEVNQIVGRTPGFGIVNVNQLFYMIWPVAIGGLLYLFDVKWQIYFIEIVMGCLTVFFLTLESVHGYFEKLYIPIKFHLGFQQIQEGTKFMPEKHRRTLQPVVAAKAILRKFQKPEDKDAIPEDSDAIEAHSDLVIAGEFRLGHGPVGFYLLKVRDQWFIVFAWDSHGLDPAIDPETAAQYNHSSDQALRMLPPKTLITFDYRSYRSDYDEQRRLDALIANVKTPLEKALLYSQKKNVRAMTERGERQMQMLTVYVQTPLDSKFGQDLFDKLYAGLESFATRFSPEKGEISKADLYRKLRTSYDKAFRRFNTTINTKFHHPCSPLSAQEMVDIDYFETHEGKPPNVLNEAQLLIVTEDGLKASVNGLTHLNALLFRGERGKQAVPQAGREYVKLQAKRRFLGAMQVGKMQAYEDVRGAELGQIRFMSELMKRSELEDYRIVTQIGPTNALYQSFLVSREGRGAVSQKTNIESTGRDIAVVADEILNESAEAQRGLFKGKRVNSVATLVWLSRKSPRELANDFEVLETSLDATVSEHCKERIFDFWKQCQPWCATPILTAPYKRTVLFQSDEASGLIQQIKPCTLDRQGIHFLSSQFKSPVHLDIFTLLSHLAIFATTRAGKSVLMADLIMNYFFRGIPVVAFDFPKPTDGSSTYYDLVVFLASLGGKASYFKTREQSLNLIHIPSLEGLREEGKRLEQILAFHVKAILVILGQIDDSMVKKAVNRLVISSYRRFQASPEIQARYRAAQKSKLGSEDWNNAPTLWDYLAFLNPWYLEYKAEKAVADDTEDKAISLITGELRAALEGEYGNAIAKPTTFDPEAQLLVFAVQEMTDPNEAAIMALAAYSALLSRAMASDDSAFFIDETPILFEFDSISQIVKQLCANGLKTGIRVVIGAQTASAITRNAAGDAIMQTIGTKIVGWHTSEAINSFVDIGFNRQLVKKYTSLSPDKSRLASFWILKREDKEIEVEYIPSDLLLSIVANNQDEQAARNRIMELYENPLEGVSVFSGLYAKAMRGGVSMDKITKKMIEAK